MAIELEGLEFQIEAKSGDGAKGVEALAKSFETLKKALSGKDSLEKTSTKLDTLNKSLEGFHVETIERIGNALRGLDGLGKVNIPASVPKRLNEIGDALHAITLSDVERLEDMTKALQDLGSVSVPKINIPSATTSATTTPVDTTGATTPQDSGIEDVTSQVQQTGRAFNAATVAITAFKGVLSATKFAAKGVGFALSSMFPQEFAAVGNVFKATLNGIKHPLLTLKTAAQKAGSAIGGLIKKAAAIPKNLGAKMAAQVKQTTASLGGFLSSLKRIAMYRLVRSAISALTTGFKEGVQNLYQYSLLMGGQFAGSMNSLATNAQYLKNSLGAMAAPILEALAPAIDFVVQKIVYLFNLINQLFARLGGKTTTTVAKKVSATFADAADNASGAADKLKKSLLGFDEINALTDNSSTSGSGSETPDYGSMFEEVPIDNTISDFADRLKQAFEDSNWKELGTLLGNKVNEVIDNIDWNGTGKKLGKVLNGAIETAYWFLKSTDFTKLGTRVAEFLNGALSEIDGETLGRLLVRTVTAGLDFLIGAVTGLDWKLVGKTIGDAIKGIFNEAQEWIAGIDWSQLAHDLYQALKDLIEGLDFAGIAKSFFKFLGSALAAAVSFIGTIVGDIWSDIKDYFKQYIDTEGKEGFLEIGWAIISGIFKGIGEAIKNIGKWIKENIFDPFIEGFKECFGIHSPSTVMAEMGGYLIEGLLDGILAPIKKIGKWIEKNILKPIRDAFDKAGLTIETAIALVKDGWDTLTEWVGEIGKKAVKLVQSGWKTLSDWVGTIKTKTVSLIQSGWTTLNDWVGEIKTKAVSLIQSGWTTLSNWVGEVGNKAVTLIKSGWNTLSEWVGEIKTKAVSLIQSGWTTLSNWVGEIGSKAFSLAKSGWTTLSDWVGDIGSKAFSLARSGWSSISSFVGDIGSKAFSLAKSGWTTLSSWVGDIGSKAVSLTRSGWTSLSSWVGTSVSAAVSLARSGWSSISSFVGTSVSTYVSLVKSGWSSLSSWVGSSTSISAYVSLAKSGWSSISGWIGSSAAVYISLYRSGWSSISSWIGSSVSVGISLFKSGWSSIKSFFGLSSGGSVGANGGVKYFAANGGVFSGRGIPAYANGTPKNVNHGTMFVAGESGAEMVGHINGRSEVMNRFQLASVMKTSITEGMAQYATYLTSILNHMTTCFNSSIAATLCAADNVVAAIGSHPLAVDDTYIEWMNQSNGTNGDGFGDSSTEQIAEGIRSGLYDTTSRQNELLREQNELLKQILDKDTTVEVTTNSFTKALNRKNQRDGKVIVPVGT